MIDEAFVLSVFEELPVVSSSLDTLRIGRPNGILTIPVARGGVPETDGGAGDPVREEAELPWRFRGVIIRTSSSRSLSEVNSGTSSAEL